MIPFYRWNDDFMILHPVRIGCKELKSGLTSAMKIQYIPADKGCVDTAQVEKVVVVDQ
jgi:hypothetical protein